MAWAPSSQTLSSVLPLQDDQISHPHQTTRKITTITFVSKFIDRWQTKRFWNELLQTFPEFTLFSIYTILNLHYSQFTLFSIYTILNLHYSQFTLFSIYTILNLHYSQFTLFSIYTILNLHYSQFTLFSIYTILNLHCSQFTLFSIYTILNLHYSQFLCECNLGFILHKKVKGTLVQAVWSIGGVEV